MSITINHQTNDISGVGGSVTINGNAVPTTSLTGITNTASPYTVALGQSAGTNSTGTGNIAIGYQALDAGNSGGYGIAIGYSAASNATTSTSFVAIGLNAMLNPLSGGAYGVYIGESAGRSLTFGGSHVVIGYNAGYSMTSSNADTAVGYNALSSYSGPQGTNVALGANAGSSLTAGGNNIIIGENAQASSATISNEITLGNSSITRFRVPGVNIYANNNALGIGSTALTTGWNTSARVVDFSTVGMGLTGAGHGFISYNAQNTTISGESWTYRANDEAGLLQLNTDGTLNYFTAASGTAGNAISFTARLQVGANYTTLGTSLIVGSGRTGEVQLTVTNNNRYLYYYLAPDGGNFGVWDNTGGYNRYYSDVSGNFWIRGTLTQNSDETLKTNWRSLPSDFVNKLATVKSGLFDRIDMDNKTVVGLSAQSLQTVLPQAVHKDEKGILSVEYATTAAVATVELAKKVVEQEARIAQLEALVNNLIKNGV